MTRDDITKHEDKFVREPMSGCWIWIASVDKNGYGMLWNGKKMDRAHRLFYSYAFKKMFTVLKFSMIATTHIA